MPASPYYTTTTPTRYVLQWHQRWTAAGEAAESAEQEEEEEEEEPEYQGQRRNQSAGSRSQHLYLCLFFSWLPALHVIGQWMEHSVPINVN